MQQVFIGLNQITLDKLGSCGWDSVRVPAAFRARVARNCYEMYPPFSMRMISMPMIQSSQPISQAA